MSAVLQFTLKAKDEASRVVKSVTGSVKDDVKALDSTVGKLAQSFGLSESKSAALAKSLPMIGVAAGAVGSAVVGLGTAIFVLTKSASDAGSEIFEAGQKTNLTAEFLSVLKVQAEQSGSTLESSAAKATKFANSLVDAARGNKDLTADLKRFGIDAAQAYRNPEAALKTFIEQFNKLPPSAANNEAAMKLFKDRTGEIIPVLRSFGGDYDELVRKLDASGQVWTQEGVEKADAFGDQLTELQQIASGVANTFAREVMPDITDAMREISKSFGENRDMAREWGKAVGDFIRGVRAVLDSNGGTILAWLGKIVALTSPLIQLAEATRALGLASRGTTEPSSSDPGRRFGGQGNALPGVRTWGEAASTPSLASGDVVNETAAKKADSARKRVQSEAEREAERQAGVVKGLTNAYAKLAAEVEHFNDAEVEQRIVQMRLSSGLETLTGQRRREAENLLNLTAQEMRSLEVKKQIREAQEKARKQLESDAEFITRAKDALGELIGQERTHVDTIRLFIYEGMKQGTILDSHIQKLLLLAAAGKDAAASLADVMPVGNVGDIPMPKGPGGNVLSGPIVSPEDIKAMGEPPPPNFDLWHEALGGLKDTAKGAFGGITQGFGAMIQSFLMGEKGAAKSFGAIAKAAISSMAAQASISALFELAQGFAWLFINPPKAAAHFQAAAVFGIVAGAAGAASALIPGGGNTSSAFATNSSFGGGGFASQSNDPRVVEQSRNTAQQQVIILRVESSDSHIISVVHDDVRKNGPTRNLIIETAAA